MGEDGFITGNQLGDTTLNDDLAGVLWSWVYIYYISPIISDSGYNLVNTITWAIILGISILLIVKVFDRIHLNVDSDFILATVPYILAGSSLRVIEDARILSPPASYLLITPLIYLVVAFVTTSSLFFSLKLFKGLRFYVVVGILWTALNLILLSHQPLERPWVPIFVLIFGSSLTAVLYLLLRGFTVFKSRCNILIILAHMLDASSTYIGVDWLDYSEKHVIPTFFIDHFKTALVMYPLKILILIPVLAAVDSTLREEPNLRGLARLTLLVLGLAPALRNTLRMALGI